ncbi:spore gernimation protein GerK [Clostridium carboxidivorans P7]|uniref:GerA spore germination protein n=1 Tax=Clostridium carboxidivorans P7 TaxID=536227 RepID=C6PZ28_9CLOT|nr:spore germination protein [Clostridium carboxidivorans]AKN31395.1 spore gernimation protein GerK [Clostridium carboxidivorans P7]EET85514.1 GerA spore germination protein [Clostridium carboxidivorans P7]EFG87214.1 putative spore germination protein KA [Clostridium carboxidivorans P7]
MLNFLKNIFSLKSKNTDKPDLNKDTDTYEYEKTKVSHILQENKIAVKDILSDFSDLVIREVKITNNPKFGAMLVYLNNMMEAGLIEESIIEKITSKREEYTYNPGTKEYSKYLFGIRDEDIHIDMDKVIDSILSGKLILFIDGLNEAMVININKAPARSIEEPQVETVIRGPREGFNESMTTNITLIRKKIKSTKLKMETIKIGRETRTDITIAYLDTVANPRIVNEVKERLNKIDVDAIIAANYIKEYMEDDPISIFPTIFSTERPDVVATKILEGRIAVIVDGTPLVITVPSLFIEFLITNEDYYLKFVPGTINRWIRYLSFILTITLPGTYLAITTFHQEVIPTPLLITFIRARSRVPYSELLECFLMLLMYEILREAGVRMPRAVGQALSVVGALVLGQAAVEAGIVSTPMVIVVSTTAICSFSIPATDMYAAVVAPRFIFMMLGGTFGLLGLTCGIILLFMKLISKRSFGVPYMAPLAPFISEEFPDLLMRRPIWTKFKRSWLITGRSSIKRKTKSHRKSIKEEQKKAEEEKNKE